MSHQVFQRPIWVWNAERKNQQLFWVHWSDCQARGGKQLFKKLKLLIRVLVKDAEPWSCRPRAKKEVWFCLGIYDSPEFIECEHPKDIWICAGRKAKLQNGSIANE